MRAGLVVLAINQGVPGLWAALQPRSFYQNFPLPSHPWVAVLPPYNEHLLRDLGALSVSVALVLAAAALFLEARLVTIALLSTLTFIVPHTLWHLWHLGPYAPGDIAAQIILNTLGIGIALSCLRWSWKQALPAGRALG